MTQLGICSAACARSARATRGCRTLMLFKGAGLDAGCDPKLARMFF